jgi:hypothetical protein
MSIKVMCFVGAKDRIKIFIGEGQEDEVFVNFNPAIGKGSSPSKTLITAI